MGEARGDLHGVDELGDEEHAPEGGKDDDETTEMGNGVHVSETN